MGHSAWIIWPVYKHVEAFELQQNHGYIWKTAVLICINESLQTYENPSSHFCNSLPQKLPWQPYCFWCCIAACYRKDVSSLNCSLKQTGLLRQHHYLRLREDVPLYWGHWQLFTAPSLAGTMVFAINTIKSMFILSKTPHWWKKQIILWPAHLETSVLSCIYFLWLDTLVFQKGQAWLKAFHVAGMPITSPSFWFPDVQ